MPHLRGRQANPFMRFHQAFHVLSQDTDILGHLADWGSNLTKDFRRVELQAGIDWICCHPRIVKRRGS